MPTFEDYLAQLSENERRFALALRTLWSEPERWPLAEDYDISFFRGLEIEGVVSYFI